MKTSADLASQPHLADLSCQWLDHYLRLFNKQKRRIEVVVWKTEPCLLHKLSFQQNSIINFHPANRALCNSIPDKFDTTFHLISSMPRMSLAFFTLQLMTVIHSPEIQVWFFFSPPATTSPSKCNAGSSSWSSSQPRDWDVSKPSGKVSKHHAGALNQKTLLFSLQRATASPSQVSLEPQIPWQLPHRQDGGTAGTWDAHLARALRSSPIPCHWQKHTQVTMNFPFALTLTITSTEKDVTTLAGSAAPPGPSSADQAPRINTVSVVVTTWGGVTMGCAATMAFHLLQPNFMLVSQVSEKWQLVPLCGSSRED